MNTQNSPQSSNQHNLPSSKNAVISLVVGILSFLFSPMPVGIAAILIGLQARKETRAVPPIASGDGLATSGIVLGWIQAILSVGLIIFGIVVFIMLAFSGPQ